MENMRDEIGNLTQRFWKIENGGGPQIFDEGDLEYGDILRDFRKLFARKEDELLAYIASYTDADNRVILFIALKQKANEGLFGDKKLIAALQERAKAYPSLLANPWLCQYAEKGPLFSSPWKNTGGRFLPFDSLGRFVKEKRGLIFHYGQRIYSVSYPEEGPLLLFSEATGNEESFATAEDFIGKSLVQGKPIKEVWNEISNVEIF